MSGVLPPPKAQSVPESGLSAGQPQNGSCAFSGWVWGVDPSTRLVAIACVGPGGEHVTSEKFTKNLTEGRRLTDIRRVTRSLTAVLVERFPPAAVYVEQPFASKVHVEPTLYYAVGVIMEALYSALEFRSPSPIEVRQLHLSSWKKAALGNGAAKKHEIAEWAYHRGHRDLLQDEADALGVAVAGAKLLEPQPEQLSL